MEIERSIWIDAPREQVWQAVMDLDQVVKWFVPHIPGAQMQRDNHDKIMVMMGPVGVDFARLENIEAPRRFTSRTLPDSVIATTYNLDEDKGGTCVTVRVTGFESLVEGAQQEHFQRCAEGWEKTLQNLKAHVDNAELPHQQVLFGPLFGFWRDSKNTLAIERSIWIDGSRERVWAAITDPKQLQQWFSPTTEWQVSAFEVGGRMYTLNPETNAEMYVQIFELIDPPNQLVTRSVPETPEPVVKGTTYLLKEEKGGTRLTVISSGYELHEQNAMEQNAFGFGMMLQNIKAVVEKQELPFPMGF